MGVSWVLGNMDVNLYLHLLKHNYPKKLTDENLGLAVKKPPMSMIPFNKVIIFPSCTDLECKLIGVFFIGLFKV
jgi:hypothetical protein